MTGRETAARHGLQRPRLAGPHARRGRVRTTARVVKNTVKAVEDAAMPRAGRTIPGEGMVGTTGIEPVTPTMSR